jgi:exopolyphosphatase/guanosine-5'-triphosphate,3'-diphosphate pyrophosphatase
MKKIFETINSTTFEERIKKYGLRPDRADVIVPAVHLLRHVIDNLKTEFLRVPKVGLREGVLLEVLRTTSSRSERQLVKFAEGLVRRFKGDLNHSRVVTKFALQIYDSLPSSNKKAPERLYLKLASILHDIGSSISPESHHKHTYYILHQVPFVGLTKEEKEIVAQIARYHRKAHPSSKHPQFAALSKDVQEIVARCASILRIAEALDQEHLPSALSLEVSYGEEELKLKLSGDDCELEAWKAKKRADLFEKMYKTKVVIQ